MHCFELKLSLWLFCMKYNNTSTYITEKPSSLLLYKHVVHKHISEQLVFENSWHGIIILLSQIVCLGVENVHTENSAKSFSTTAIGIEL